MNEPESVVVQPLQAQFLEDVIRIHRLGLGYTLNSRLGTKHLQFLYQSMSQDPDCYVGVALAGTRPLGVISGTANADILRARLLRSATAGTKIRLAFSVLRHPSLVSEWSKGSAIGAPVRFQNQEVAAVLTAIAVDPGSQGRGIGQLLVAALEEYFAEHGICIYKLDTLIANKSARDFYHKLGFQELEIREDTVILIKTIQL